MKRISYLLMAVLFGVMLQFSASSAQDSKKIDPKTLPSLLAAGNGGQEFLFSMPPCYIDAGADNSIRIYVSSGVKTEVSLSANGFQKKAMTIPNGVIEFELSPGQGQAYTKGLNDQAQPERVFQQAAIHITAKAPIICYAVTRFHYTSDSFLAIPIDALGKDYIVASYPDMTAMYPTYVLPSVTTITGAYDNTKVFFTLGGNSITQTAGGMKPGQQKSWTINKGDVIVIGSKGMEADLSGSRITATKPVAVTSGNQCANIPTNNTACDFIAEMELPMHTWGKEYHYTRLIARKFNNIIRIFAKENNTNVFLDGQSWKLIQKGGGGKISENYIEVRIDGAPAPHVISADKPIYIMQYNPGQSEDGVSSDPFQMVLTPLEQYQQEITFCTPGIRGGVGFAQNYVNLVYELSPENTIPDDLEFAQVDEFTGAFVWSKLSAKFSGAIGQKFPIDVKGKPYAAKIIQLPGDGVYKIRSKSGSKFAAYAYGFDNFDSYGMPTSVALGNTLDPQAPVPEWTMSCEGEVTGTVKDHPLVETDSLIRTNIARIYVVEDSTTNYILTKEDFVAGEQQTVRWKLTPEDKNKPAKAKVLFADQAGNETYRTLVYEPFAVEISPDPLDFGALLVGATDQTEKTITIKNTAPKKTLITKLKIDPSDRFTMLNEPTYPLELNPAGEAGSSFELKVKFSTAMPKGSFAAKLTVSGECGSKDADIKGALGRPKIRVHDVAFGTTGVNQPVMIKEILIESKGEADLVISGVNNFTQTVFGKAKPATGSTGIIDWEFSPPIVIRAGTSTKLSVSYQADKEGDFTDRLTFIHNDAEVDVQDFSNITAKAVKGGLIANGGDFAGKRVNRGPYSKDNLDKEIVVTITNPSATNQITLNTMEVAGGVRNDFFTTENGDRNFTALVADKVLEPGGILAIKVLYNPNDAANALNATGNHSIEFEIRGVDAKNPGLEPARAEVKGTGLLPKLTITPLVDFGSTEVKGATSVPKKMVIRNQGTTDGWNYGYDAVITGFSVDPTGAVQVEAGPINPSNDPANKGFRYVSDTYFGAGKTITIGPDGEYTIDADFIAQQAGAVTATLTPITDADVDVSTVKSQWIGNGLSALTEATVTPATYCPGEEGTVTLTVRSKGNTSIEVTNVTSDQAQASADAEFSVDASQFPITVPQGESRNITVKVIYKGTRTGKVDHTGILMIEGTDNFPVSASFSTQTFERTSSIPNLEATVAQEELLEVPIILDNGANFSLATTVQDFNVVLNFPTRGLLKFVEATPSMNGMTVVGQPAVDYSAGTVKFALRSATPMAGDAAGELVRVKFKVLLPEKAIAEDESKYKEQFTHTLTSTSSSCLAIVPKAGELTVDPVCANNMRRIEISDKPFAGGIVGSNPVSGDNAEIEVSLGFSVSTEIVIFNSMGTEVFRFSKDNMPAGTYRVTVPVRDLSSGAYTYRINAGPFQKTESMIIAK